MRQVGCRFKIFRGKNRDTQYLADACSVCIASGDGSLVRGSSSNLNLS